MKANNLKKIAQMITSLLEIGGNEAAEPYLLDEFKNLPEPLQHEIALTTFIDAMKKETLERDRVAHIQEVGMAAVDILQSVKSGDVNVK